MLFFGLLAACSSGEERAARPDSGKGRQGGTLRAAFVGGGASETLDFFRGPTALDMVRARAWHGTLGNLDPKAEDGVRYGVLKGIDISADLGTYTLRLREDVRFTDGSRLGPADVLHSPRLAGARTLPAFKLVALNFDLRRAKAHGPHAVSLPTLRPIADGRLILCQGNFLVVKDGTREITERTPGCGPFRLTEFVPGQGAAFRRHDEYYGGAPSLDGLELRSIADAQARLNALTSGQVDFAHDLSPVVARTLGDSGRIRLAPSRARISSRCPSG
nr:ABC transporter substrate-binding protein [Streptomyces sp. SPB074]